VKEIGILLFPSPWILSFFFFCFDQNIKKFNMERTPRSCFNGRFF